MEAPSIPPRISSIRQSAIQPNHIQQANRHSISSGLSPVPPPTNTGQPRSDLASQRSEARRELHSPQHRKDFLIYLQREIATGSLPNNLHQYSPGARGPLLREAYRVFRTHQSGSQSTTSSDSPRHTLKRKASDTELEGSARGPPPRYTHGASAADAIDLTSPPKYSSMSTVQQRQTHRQSSHVHRRPSATSSPIVLPPWQSDADVLQCPCCGTQFGWIARKHHCRKCGKVVCGSCSTHRIAIPSKYQVHPPEANAGAAFPSLFNVSPEQGRHTGRPDPQSDATEKVRVCNPCVPDPNPYPPGQAPQSPTDPQYTSSSTASHRRQYPLTAYASAPAPFGPPPIPDRRGSGFGASHAGVSVDPAATQLLSDSRLASSSYITSMRRSTMHSQRPPPSPEPPSSQAFAHHAPSGVFPGHRHASSLSSYRNHPRFYGMEHGAAPSTNRLASSMIPAQAPRREIAEEDECPICQRELPLKGPNGETADREQHVEDCIKQYSSSASSSTAMLPPPSGSATDHHRRSSNTPAAVTATGTISASAPSGSSHFPSRSSSMSQPPSQAGPSAPPHRPNRLLPYTATEKDCTTASGESVECVICFEEFEPGDKMARMDCFCKFHEDCLRNWWASKPGKPSCPTHQVDGI